MTTPQINSAQFDLIDAAFPIAGQDNDSQVFRTNYTYIVQSFAAANVDITGLWSNVDSLNSNVSTLQGNLSNYGNLSANVTTLQSDVSTLQDNVTTLSGNITTINSTAVFKNAAVNQMGGNIIAGAAKSFSDISSNVLALFGNIILDYAVADFQVCSYVGDYILSFVNWPATGYATINALISISQNDTLTFPASVFLSNITEPTFSSNGSSVIGNIANVQSRIGNTLTSLISGGGNFLFEFSTVNGGSTVYVEEKIHP